MFLFEVLLWLARHCLSCRKKLWLHPLNWRSCGRKWPSEARKKGKKPAKGPGEPAKGIGPPAKEPGVPAKGVGLPAKGPGVPAKGNGPPAKGDEAEPMAWKGFKGEEIWKNKNEEGEEYK